MYLYTHCNPDIALYLETLGEETRNNQMLCLRDQTKYKGGVLHSVRTMEHAVLTNDLDSAIILNS